MNIKTLLLALATACTVGMTPIRAIGPDASPIPPPPESTTPSTSPTPPAQPANSMIPSATFPIARYEALWTKSPFAVATSEETVQASPDYLLVGIANVDGIFYASVLQRDNQEHFLISSDKLTRGMTLKSISRSPDGQDTYATVVKDGQTLTLKMEPPAAGAVVGPGALPNMPAPPNAGIVPQNLTMPSSSGVPGQGAAGRPFPRLHRPQINLPPRIPPPTGTPPAALRSPQQQPTNQMAPPPPH